MSKFQQAIKQFGKKVDRRIEGVAKEATQETVRLAQDNVPVDTGFLKNSIRGAVGNTPKENSTSPAVALAQWDLKQPLQIGWTANYARVQEARRGFVRLAADKWPDTVSKAVRKAKGR